MLRPFIKAVGTGKKGARNLTGEEAARAMRAILQGEASPVQFAAFAIALRIKGETSEELAAFVDAIREHYGWPPVGSWEGLDVGVPYDGKSRGPSLTPGAAILASAAGLRVSLHGDVDVPMKRGLGPGPVLEALGIPSFPDPGASCGVPFAYFSAAEVAPELSALKPVRWELGLRPFLSTVEKLLNPLGAKHSLVGMFHRTVAERVAATQSLLGFSRGLAVQGAEGTVEVEPGPPTSVFEWKEGSAERWAVEPGRLGYPNRLNLPEEPWTAEASARETEEVLSGGDSPFRSTILLTAALMLFAGGRAESLEEGVRLAQETLASGRARDHLKALRGERVAAA